MTDALVVGANTAVLACQWAAAQSHAILGHALSLALQLLLLLVETRSRIRRVLGTGTLVMAGIFAQRTMAFGFWFGGWWWWSWIAGGRRATFFQVHFGRMALCCLLFHSGSQTSINYILFLWTSVINGNDLMDPVDLTAVSRPWSGPEAN